MQCHKLQESLLPEDLWDKDFVPTEEDRKASRTLYTETHTRISTQPLHYRPGDEEAVLGNLYRLLEFVGSVRITLS